MTTPKKGTNTPWGVAHSVCRIAKGIYCISTPSHGGYWLDDVRHTGILALCPSFRTWAGGPWYEEDEDWAVVALTYPEAFEAPALRHALRVASHHFPCPSRLNAVCGRVAAWEREHAAEWEVGSRGTSSCGKRVWCRFTRVGDGTKRDEVIDEWPEDCFYSDERLASMIVG